MSILDNNLFVFCVNSSVTLFNLLTDFMSLNNSLFLAFIAITRSFNFNTSTFVIIAVICSYMILCDIAYTLKIKYSNFKIT